VASNSPKLEYQKVLETHIAFPFMTAISTMLKETGVQKQYDLYQINHANLSQESSDHTMFVQSARIASCRGNSTSLPLSGGSQQIQSKFFAIISAINFAAQCMLSLAKHNCTAQ